MPVPPYLSKRRLLSGQPDIHSIMIAVNERNKKITLKVLRKRLKMNQAQFAEALGVLRTTVSAWENGVHKPSLSIEQVKILDELLGEVNLRFKDLHDDLAS
ncbi:helix-turn-helix domain protein [[Leptolyngbya] sp. PCC 7376]|uniref:helix-turn-helix transcriptional regulator n=1 Tax=[Leptolyngbya] sp. PCC 7376 TaxID=111781 RepID=UPI00029F3A17|nr:helix-turn-helix transcriptional regulator [[Leptolyngbya] sp. PCC 7376]AFY39917.1 helix-turn-helix domain protein [[Leptolyngbya] sp. PCC 7376]